MNEIIDVIRSAMDFGLSTREICEMNLDQIKKLLVNNDRLNDED
jgi:hypothetical protein